MDKEAVIESIRDSLRARVEDWVGFDIPSEGSDDPWQSKLMDVDDVQSIEDLIEYLDAERMDLAEFAIQGEHDLVLAGMAPTMIPRSVIEQLGDRVDPLGQELELRPSR